MGSKINMDCTEAVGSVFESLSDGMNEMSNDQLDKLIDRLSSIKNERDTKELKEWWEGFEVCAKKLEIPINEAIAMCSEEREEVNKKRRLRAKFKDPENSENSWAGRGKVPNWLKDYERAGRDRSEFKV